MLIDKGLTRRSKDGIIHVYSRETPMFIFVHPDHGAAYAMDDGALISTPLHDDLTYDSAFDNWTEVDMEVAVAEGRNPEMICRLINKVEDLALVYVG